MSGKDVFLCHTGADKEWVEHLAERLERESLGGRNVSVWFDAWDVDGGENILSRIEEGLKKSRFVAVVLSPAMTRADWPTMEWQTQVHDDPAGKRGRILPILRHLFDPITQEPIEIPLPLKILKRYDFSSERNSAREFEALVRRIRGDPPPRGRTVTAPLETDARIGPEMPDEIGDSLLSNLLPVLQLPPLIFSDECSEKDPSAIIEKLKPRWPWLLNGGRLFSFCDPQATRNPFAPVLTRRLQRKERFGDWLKSEDRAALAVRLLNDALRSLCRSKAIRTLPGSKEQFFFAIPNGRPRKFRWGPSGRDRTLAKLATGPAGESLGVHHAARLRFLNLGGSAYLLIQPGWTFTSDGANPLPGKQLGILSMRWGGRERNAAVLRNTLMWGLVLSSGSAEIAMEVGQGTIPIRVAAVPAHTDVGVGIEGDSIRLTRILGGEGAGEVDLTGENSGDELDQIAALGDVILTDDPAEIPLDPDDVEET